MDELTHQELITVIKQLTDSLKLEPSVMHSLFGAADLNTRGAIEYEAYTPIAARIIETDRRMSEKELCKRIERAGKELLEIVNAGRLNFEVDDVEHMMRHMFETADNDYNGYLDMTQMHRLMHNSGMSLTDAEVHAVLASADFDQDGRVEYNAFVPVVWEAITRAVAHIRYQGERREKAAEESVEAADVAMEEKEENDDVMEAKDGAEVREPAAPQEEVPQEEAPQEEKEKDAVEINAVTEEEAKEGYVEEKEEEKKEKEEEEEEKEEEEDEEEDEEEEEKEFFLKGQWLPFPGIKGLI